ncbi:hypothetical protein GIB67_021893 [Kingdonia uniflora]|uniref:Uncharacterized protein n=1 Tax=Kingdonia uniflora TaxID=39325 RepID=A0A7J7KVB1_9MAGN|nr:hypothetical protein GIB67_021893 [Kingdonia uniflora]
MDLLVVILNPSVSTSLAPMHPLYVVFSIIVYALTLIVLPFFFSLLQCLQTPTHSEIYTVDLRNVEHVLKTNFSNYGKYYERLICDGIYAVDGEKWRHQQKLASYVFSTKVLRDFSSVVFLANAAKLVAKVSEAATSNMKINLQELLMKYTLASIFTVGFGTELNSLSE